VDFLSLIFQAMWGVKMQVFKSQKVLAVGQTSGSGGWVKKFASMTMRGDGLSIVFGNPKRQWPIRLALRGSKSEIGSLHCVPVLRKEL